MLVGLVEVVLIVGAAFAVSMRRNVRDLGLLVSTGGAPGDVRRVVLAQGTMLGVGASLLGAAGGFILFFAGAAQAQHFIGETLWDRSIDWVSVIGLTLLGSFSAVIAALMPAWTVGRITPIEAMSGRFPVRASETPSSRGPISLIMLGFLLLLGTGLWTAREFSPSIRDSRPSLLPVVAGGVGVVILLVGAVWGAPYVVFLVSCAGKWLPVTVRFAFRDSARHRFRTAAAAVTLGVAAAGAVLTAFGINAATAYAERDLSAPPHTLIVYLDDGDSSVPNADVGDKKAESQRAIATVQHILGHITSHIAYRVRARGATAGTLAFETQGFTTEIRAIDESTLEDMIGRPSAHTLEVFRSGGVVTTEQTGIRNGQVTVAVVSTAGKPGARRTLPAVRALNKGVAGTGDFSTAWMSTHTARRLGLALTPAGALVQSGHTITPEALSRLSIHGINAFSPDADTAWLPRLVEGALAATALVTTLIAGVAVALAAADGKDDVATMAAVGAGPWHRRAIGGMQGLIVGAAGCMLGLLVGIPAGLSLGQLDGAPGTHVPWLSIAGICLVPLLASAAGWIVAPTRLRLASRER